MFKSLLMNYISDLVAKAAAAGLTVAVSNGLINHDQQTALYGAVGALIALAFSAAQKIANTHAIQQVDATSVKK